MKQASFTLILVAAAVASGCGARTGDDDLLGFEPYPSGGRSGADGGSFGIGGEGPGIGGSPTGVGGSPTGIGGTAVGVGGNLMKGSCCTEQEEVPGCSTPTVEQCVCAVDPFCCSSGWDEICVQQAIQGCDASCGSGGTSSGGAPSGGAPSGGAPSGGAAGGSDQSCCEYSGERGCSEAPVEECVCGLDPYCCETEWDQICIGRGIRDCNAQCGSVGSGGASGGGSSSTGGEGGLSRGGNCCEGHNWPGCELSVVEECVCKQDPYCCGNRWDDLCVVGAQTQCGVDCGVDVSTGGSPSAGGGPNMPPLGECCEAHNAMGCNDPDVVECVCTMDPYCCNTSWDGTCVSEAYTKCGAGCEQFSSGGGGSSTGGSQAGGGSGGTTDPDFAGDCCDPHGSAGCETSSVEECVCAEDSYCCDTEWDNYCSAAALSDCGANCNDVDECKMAFPSACGVCACEQCIGDVNGCLGDFGCINIFSCIQSSGCTGINCYSPATCQAQIDDAGGLTGVSASTALDLVSCASSANCPCQ